MLNLGPRTTKDPQLSELAGLMNVKDYSKTIVLAEAVGFTLSPETRMCTGSEPIHLTAYPFPHPYLCWSS
jgi:hypothetical protein